MVMEDRAYSSHSNLVIQAGWVLGFVFVLEKVRCSLVTTSGAFAKHLWPLPSISVHYYSTVSSLI